MNPVPITNEPTAFTARQLADASGQTRQNIQQLLQGVAPSSQCLVNGNLASAWHFPALPAPFQLQLQAIAQNRGYADAPALLARFAAPEKPAPALPIPAALVNICVKNRAVWQPFLEIKDTDSRTQAEFEAAGAAAYTQIFGHPITGRWFRKLFQRFIQRDAGREDFNRLDLYLPEKTTVPPAPRPAVVNKLPESLAALVKTLDNPARPSAADAKFLFDAAFRHLEEQTAAAPARASAVKRSLIHALHAAVPALATTGKAFRRTWNRKHAAWLLAGGTATALEDQRKLRSGNFRKPDFSADEKKIRDESILHDGSISLAYRKLRQTGQLSAAFVKYYDFNPRHNKSYVPGTVRDTVTPEVEMCGPIHHGPWLAKMRGPYIPRDWSAVQPADWFSGDDVTFNHVWFDYDEAGKLQLHRGECLILIDLRTGYILDYVLIAGHYNSRHIRKLILKVHDRYGLPHLGYYLERGVWKARNIRDLDARENVAWRETESGMAQFNLHVKHATTPRAKTIEGIIRILQERQRNEPAFVGFNERMDERERMQDYLARVRRGTADPAKLLTMEKWSQRLNEVFRDYNNDPQNGKMLQGASPAEAWQTGLQRQPLRQLPEDARYLLATHCRRLTIRQQGIVLTIGGNKMLYCNEQTGRLIGREVLAYYNFDCPELLTVSDLKRQNYFTVKNISLPAMSATKEQFAPVHAAISGHRKPAKEIYGNIQRQCAHTITRDNDVSEETKEIGRFVNNQTEQFQREQTTTRRTLRKIQTAAASAGLQLPGNIRQPDRVLRAIQDEAELRAQMAAEQNSSFDTP